ncbi:MAG: acetoacetate decarboxylase family protein [Leptospiraceae bacterium]|nr:acetoacetate decarboxylase family protein [Leptospiraceae bacterium]MDW8305677.1 acetoacetate decarboxylase family protein [Leptospiraceae bacterium]
MDHALKVPPPWTLHGRGYILVLKKDQLLASDLPPWQQAKHSFFSFPMVMFVDYDGSPIGPYYELLYIPGRFKTHTGSYWTISKIYVSTETSVRHGRENWGIPKKLANFEVHYLKNEVQVQVFYDEKLVARFHLKNRGPTIWVTSSLLSKSLHSFCQVWDKKAYYFVPKARGKLGLCQILDCQGYGHDFLPFGPQNVHICLVAPVFEMVFPLSHIAALPKF